MTPFLIVTTATNLVTMLDDIVADQGSHVIMETRNIALLGLLTKLLEKNLKGGSRAMELNSIWVR